MTHHTRFTLLIRKKFCLVICLMVLSVVLLMSALIYLSFSNRDDSTLIGTFDNQRMLIQLMVKDVTHKYSIMNTLKTGPLVASRSNLTSQLKTINSSLTSNSRQFEDTLTGLQNGKVEYNGRKVLLNNHLKELSPLINKADASWDKFRKCVNVIISSDSTSVQAATALIYINNNNDALENDFTNINTQLAVMRQQEFTRNMLVVILLFLVSLLALVMSLFQLQKYLALPLGELYEGINYMGIIKGEPLSAPTRKEILPIVSEINDGVKKLNKFKELIENINNNMSFEDTLRYIYRTFSAFIPYSHIGIALLKDDGRSLEASYGISDPTIRRLPKKLIGLKVALNETSIGKVIETGTPRVIDDLPGYCAGTHRIYNNILLENGIRASITLPLSINGRPVGVIFFSSTQANIYTDEHVAFLRIIANSIAISFSKSIFIDELLYSNILALTKLAESRDEDTGEHLERMKIYSRAVADFLLEDNVYPDRLTTGLARDIERFSPMHDIGKVGIRDGILLKPGKLTDEEFTEMQKHTVYGAEVLRTAEENMVKQGRSLFSIGIEIAEGHHEKWDGSGYPYGKAGEEIPLSARIVMVADVFDALTSVRPYKPAFSFERSYQMILEKSGSHFDPAVIASVTRHRDRLYAYYKKFHREIVIDEEKGEAAAAAAPALE